MKCVFVGIFGIGLAFYIYMIVERRLSQSHSLMRNEMAAIKLVPSLLPAANLYDVDSNAMSPLSSYVQGWTLINLWATWCPPCKEEMPSLELLQQQLKSRLNVIAISVDENIDAIKEFVATNKPHFKILWDREKTLSFNLGVSKYPETFLVSPDGLLIMQFSGIRDWASPKALAYFSDMIK